MKLEKQLDCVAELDSATLTLGLEEFSAARRSGVSAAKDYDTCGFRAPYITIRGPIQ